MEKKDLKFEDTKVTKSFCDAMNDWRDGVSVLSYHGYMTCFSLFALSVVQDILKNSYMAAKKTKDMVLEDMHLYLQRAGDCALEEFLEDIRKKEKEAAAAEIETDEEPKEDNGYCEKFEDD